MARLTLAEWNELGSVLTIDSRVPNWLDIASLAKAMARHGS
jgi:hypothetical protein